MAGQKKVVAVSSLLCFALVFSGCTSVHPPSGFLGDYSNLQKGEEFKQEYVESSADLSKYTKAKVEPVELRYFEDPYDQFTDAETQDLAGKLQASLESELGKKYQILTADQGADSQTLVVKPALIYVSSPERLLNLATIWLIGFQFSKGAAALEAKLVDGGSGREIGKVAEKRKSGGGITDVKSILIGGFFRFIHAEGAFKRWGKNFKKMAEPPKA